MFVNHSPAGAVDFFVTYPPAIREVMTSPQAPICSHRRPPLRLDETLAARSRSMSAVETHRGMLLFW